MKYRAPMFAVIITVIIGICASAQAMPFVNDNINNYSGISFMTKDDNGYSEAKDGRYNIYYKGSNVWTYVGQKLYTPFTTDSLYIDFDISFDEGNINSYAGFPWAIDKSGKLYSLFNLSPFDGSTKGRLKLGNTSENVFLKYMDGDAENYIDYEAGKVIRLRIICNLDEKKYSLEYDFGGGYVDCFAGNSDNPVYSWELQPESISEIRFTFIGSKAEVWQRASLSYFNISDGSERRTLYVDSASTGGDGSREAPFSSTEPAENADADVIRLFGGTYNFGEEYTFGTVKPNDEENKIIYAPVEASEAEIYGDYNIDLPELSDFSVNEEYKADLKERIRNHPYTVKYFSRHVNILNEGLVVSDASNDATFSATAKTNSLPDNELTAVIAIYNGGRLESVRSGVVSVGSSDTVPVYLCAELPPGFSFETHTVKAFVFTDMNTMKPIISPLGSEKYNNSIPISVEGVNVYGTAFFDDITVARNKNVISIACTGSFDKAAVIIKSETGDVKYLNQFSSDDGIFTMECKLSDNEYSHLYVYLGAVE